MGNGRTGNKRGLVCILLLFLFLCSLSVSFVSLSSHQSGDSWAETSQ